jgi:hypothetical protein
MHEITRTTKLYYCSVNVRKEDEITSIGKGIIGCGFFDPSGRTTCNIKKVRGILLDVNTQ